MKHKLSKEEIKFIEKYIEKSGVHFTDIRTEMVDHVASEVENSIAEGDQRDFYFIFKDYMVEHKASLLKESDRFYKASDKRILKSLLNKSLSFKGVLLLMTIFFSFKLLETIFKIEQIISILEYGPFTILIFATIFYFLLTRIKKERYSSLERLGIYFFVPSQILYQFFNPIINSENLSPNKLLRLEIGASIIIFVLIILMVSALEFEKHYTKNYQITP